MLFAEPELVLSELILAAVPKLRVNVVADVLIWFVVDVPMLPVRSVNVSELVVIVVEEA